MTANSAFKSPKIDLPKIALDKSLMCDTLTAADNCARSAGACSRFSFLWADILAPPNPKETKIASFKINHLRNAFFVTPFL
jgi:hypothetical protein